MKYCLLFLILPLVFAIGCRKQPSKQEQLPTQKQDDLRIVSLAPSITETLFALGLGKNVVGVSSFCKYPPEVASITKVGGFIDTDFETIVRLHPTCVVLTVSEADTAEKLRALGINVLAVPLTNFDQVQKSFEFIGEYFGRKEQAKALSTQFNSELQRVHNEEKTALIVVWRDYGNGYVRDVQVATKTSIYGPIAEAAGLKLLPDTTTQYPILSPESILRLQPDFIFEILPDCTNPTLPHNDWTKTLPALRSQIRIITDDFATVPGPRFTQIIKQLK